MYLRPRGTSVQSFPVWAAHVLVHAWPVQVVAAPDRPNVNSSLTTVVTTSALPRRRFSGVGLVLGGSNGCLWGKICIQGQRGTRFPGLTMIVFGSMAKRGPFSRP